MPRYMYRFDAFVNVEIDTDLDPESDEAVETAAVEARGVADGDHGEGVSVALFDAYAIEDAETGEEIRGLD